MARIIGKPASRFQRGNVAAPETEAKGMAAYLIFTI
jgi:hypothetical protein